MRVAELKLGYKASAEQFAPRELVELAVAAEAHGMDSATVSDHFQPWRHEGGHAPFSLAWMTAVGERTKRLILGTSVLTPTFRYNPAVIAQAFATMGCLYPDRIFLGVGTGEALNEIATGYEGDWPEFKERFARLRESVRLMRELWLGDRVDFDGEYYQHQGRLDLRRARGRHPGLHRRGRTRGGQVRRPRRRRLHLHLGQGRGAVQGQAHPRGQGGRRGGGPQSRRHRQDDRDQDLLRPRPQAGAGEHPVLGAAVADRRAEAQHRRPDRDGEGRRRAAHRAGRQALDRRVGSRRGRREGRPVRQVGPQPPGVPRSPATTSAGSSSCFEKDLEPRLRRLG